MAVLSLVELLFGACRQEQREVEKDLNIAELSGPSTPLWVDLSTDDVSKPDPGSTVSLHLAD